MLEKIKLYPGETQNLTIESTEGVDETAYQVREWIMGYGYRGDQVPPLDSGIWHRVVANKRRAFDQLSELGVRREHIKHCVAQCRLPGGTFSVRLSARLDWPRGDFGDGNSCLHNGYASNLDCMRHLGTLVLQFYDNYGVGVGRLWIGVYPLLPPNLRPKALSVRNDQTIRAAVTPTEIQPAKGFVSFGGYGVAFDIESLQTHRPTDILGALLLSKMSGLAVWPHNLEGGGVWIGGRPIENRKTSYNQFHPLVRPRSGRCHYCDIEIHALDSRMLVDRRQISEKNPDVEGSIECMECVLEDTFDGEVLEC